MELFAKGKRSLVYKEGNIIIKEERQDSQAVNRIENEAEWLQKLNKYKIGPKFIKQEGKTIHMEFIDGIELPHYLKNATKEEQKNILLQLLKQARTLDKLRVNKQEMHRPTKNALVRKHKLILIDFERCKKTQEPKNVTQACQFIAKRYKLPDILKKAKRYKETYSEKDFREIQRCMTNIL